MAAKQKVKQQRDSLGRFLAYVLGIRPDEFGLVPDEEGFVPVKDLIAALSEEDGWRHVRRGGIDELLREPGRNDLELKENMIRAGAGNSQLVFGPHPVASPPKVLYHACRRKGYPVILERGLRPGGRPFVILSDSKEMALRIGRRRDPNPVLLTIQAGLAEERGVVFFRPQEHLFLVDELAPDLFSGPPLPKEKLKPATDKKSSKTPVEAPTPGSFFLDVEREIESSRRDDTDKQKRKKGDVPDWKKAARKERRKGAWDK